MERQTEEVIECHKCPGFLMEDDGEWYVCPCCRCRTRGRVRQQARFEEHAAELGMTLDEYDEHMRKKADEIINPDPIPDDVLAAFVEKMRAEWTPACRHDTNPWEPHE